MLCFAAGRFYFSRRYISRSSEAEPRRAAVLSLRRLGRLARTPGRASLAPGAGTSRTRLRGAAALAIGSDAAPLAVALRTRAGYSGLGLGLHRLAIVAAKQRGAMSGVDHPRGDVDETVVAIGWSASVRRVAGFPPAS